MKNKTIPIKYQIDSDNNLIINKKTKLSGNWILTDDHDLCLKLNATKGSKSGDKIVISGLVKDVTKNSLEFEVTNQESANKIALQGTWQADKYNQLIFKVKKENSEHDILAFNNTWIINKNNRLIYKYEKAALITKKKQTHQITFKGYWKTTDTNRLYYEIDKKSGSYFDFKVGTAMFEKKRIKYKIMAGHNSTKHTLTITGNWRINPNFELSFEVDYGDNQIQPISFGGAIDLTDKDKVSFKLKNGLEIKLAHELFDKNSQAFIKYHQQPRDRKIEFGIGVKF
jgi:hypothetical protein